MEDTGFPKGYHAEHYRRDTDIFAKWLKENYPECLYVGPSATGGDVVFGKGGGGVENVAHETCGCDDLLDGTTEKLDVFSYHYYGGVSERLATVMPTAHWLPEEANGEDFLDVPMSFCRIYKKFRDKYAPGTEMWVTESGDAGGGGDTWASTYLDVLRTLNELGTFPTITDGVIFHNTLASSDYGWLRHSTFEPRPNYFAVLLWSKLMGTTVYDSEIAIQEGAHVFCHSRKDGKDGCVYLIINNSLKNTTTVELPKEALRYTLCGNGNIRNTTMYLNGTALTLGENDTLPEMEGVEVSGTIELAPGTCTFLVM